MNLFKARAWDNVEGAWVNISELLSLGGAEFNTSVESGKYTTNLTLCERYTLQPYTGVVSASGVKVYGGDVIEFGIPKYLEPEELEHHILNDIELPMETYCQVAVLFEVDKLAFVGVELNTSGEYSADELEESIYLYGAEVIGNIYDNPELKEGLE